MPWKELEFRHGHRSADVYRSGSVNGSRVRLGPPASGGFLPPELLAPDIRLVPEAEIDEETRMANEMLNARMSLVASLRAPSIGLVRAQHTKRMEEERRLLERQIEMENISVDMGASDVLKPCLAFNRKFTLFVCEHERHSLNGVVSSSQKLGKDLISDLCML